MFEGAVHQLHPAIPCLLINRERHVPHPQARMSPLLDVSRWTAKPAHEKITQPLLRAGKIMRRVHRPENVVVRHLCIKRTHQPGKPVLADAFVDLFFRQIHNSSMTDEAPKSAYELAMERLRRKDVEDGVEERALSDEQKTAIAEIKRVYSAKMAEAEILHRSKWISTFDPEERASLEQNHRRDLERLREEQERKLEKVRG